jgi:hypothetical protein
MRNVIMLPALAAVLIATTVPRAGSDPPPAATPTAALLVAGLQGTSGSAVGPDGALYVTESAIGSIARVDPQTGTLTTYATGLPPWVLIDDYGGPVDIAFIDGTAYVLVTLVGDDLSELLGEEVEGSVVGIYRVDGPDSFTVIADLGSWAMDNPPATDFFVPTGVHYALQPFRGGLLVSDGHHNRVLWVTLDGAISEVLTVGNIVPTGMAARGETIYVAMAGPVPHLPEDGRIVTFGPRLAPATVAAGHRFLVDVGFGTGNTLYALSQGFWDGPFEGTPAQPDTGELLRVNADGTFTVIMAGLDRPTSLEFIGRTAYVVTYGGEIWRIGGVPR